MVSRQSQERWYAVCHPLTRALYWLLFSLRIKGQRHVPPTGPLLVVANHQSYLDPVLVGLAVGRRVTYMARKTLWQSKPLAFIMDRLGAFPVDQEGPALEGIRATLHLLEQGESVVVFPEGSRTPDGRVQPLKAGIALLARKAKAPILPVGIAGAFEALPINRKWPHFAPLGLPGRAGLAGVVGRPIDPEVYLGWKREELLLNLGRILDGLRAEAEKLRKKE
jgi:1-acyl-sn-glycerol-3-phosphate acyltransferase